MKKPMSMARRTLLITYIAGYLLAISSIVRIFIRFQNADLFVISLLLVPYLILLLCEPFLIRKNRLLTYIYLIVQISAITALSKIISKVDFWAILFCPLIIQVMHNFSQRTGYLLTAIFSGITSIFLVVGLGLEIGLPLVFVYTTIFFLLAAFLAIINEALTAREELQRTHDQLKIYTVRAEELAVLQERNRLSRDLHDSVTQSIYSLTLLSEAGQRMIMRGDLKQAEENQSSLSEIAHQVLQEMRLLVYELRPQVLLKEGLAGAMEHRLETVERRAGINGRIHMDIKRDLPPFLEKEFYNISMEALNNALKHTNASEVDLSLCEDRNSLLLEIKDNGQGFDLEVVRSKGGMGLVSISERVEKMKGVLSIQSGNSKGTTITVSVPIQTEPKTPQKNGRNQND